MEKNNDRKENYQYPNLQEKKNHTSILIFTITFIVGVIFVSLFFKSISPEMDLDVGDNPIPSMNQRNGEDSDNRDFNVRAQIDQRLKMIQSEDEMPGVSYETPEDIVNKFRENFSDINNDEDQIINNNLEEEKEEEEKKDISIPQEIVRVQINDVQKTTITKVYVGQFSSLEKAIETQKAIIDADSTISPILKEVNGYYTAQVGAFSNYDSAKALATKLLELGFYAKIVKELK